MEYIIKKTNSLTDLDKNTMYQLMNRYYENITLDKFNQDLSKKQQVILLMDLDQIFGFTTIELIELEIEGQSILGIFSGDTIVDQNYSHSLELQLGFTKYVYDRIQGSQDQLLYWFLICKGYKTYRYLSLYLETYYPSMERETPEFEQKIMDAYARLKYGNAYNQETGIVLNNGTNDFLRAGVAPIDEKAKKNKVIRFFEEKNPGHMKGDELVCLARFEMSNMKESFTRMITRS